MNVKADRYNALKDRVKAECIRRAFSGSVSSYGGSNYDYSVKPNQESTVLLEHRNKILQPLNAINSDKVSTTTNRIINDNELLNMEAFTTTLEKRTKTDHQGTDCKSGCTGLCYGCQGSCYDACTGCTGTCSGECTGCSGTCSGSCSGCSGGCSGCGGCGGCSDSCSGGCSGCSGNCGGSGCGAGCFGSCSGGCHVLCANNNN